MNFRTVILSSSLFTLLTACSPTIAQRGNMLEDYQLQQVTAGTSTRSDVLRALGSPTTQAPFNENTWYYLGQETEKRGIFDPKVTKEKIVVVAFNEEGVVQNIQNVPPNRIDVPVSSSKTPTRGNELTIMQQFLGNLGKFNTSSEKKGPAGAN